MAGSLSVVGTGIQCPGQLTLETIDYIKQADKVFYLVPDPFAVQYITELNATAESLYYLYVEGQPRIITYNNMVEAIVDEVRAGKRVCAALYGHPGVFAYPSHKAISVARQEGYVAEMLAGVSAEDCIVSDLGLDPSVGCQSYEATSFLIRPVPLLPSMMLIIWQIGVIGDLKFTPKQAHVSSHMEILTERLLETFPADHEVIVYEASFNPAWQPRIETIRLRDLATVQVTGISTLVIPPASRAVVDHAMVERLGIDQGWLDKAPHSSSLKLYRQSATQAA